MTTAHAILPPSSAERWAGQCAGSAVMEAAYPEVEQNPDAAEGDAAHWIVATVLRGDDYPLSGTTAPNGVVIDSELLDAAAVMVDDVLEISDGALLHVEEVVQITSVHATANWGTPDVWWFNRHGEVPTLHIYDFKYGHRFVDAYENWQCLDYAAGVLDRPEFAALARNKIEVSLTVVQPRNYHPSGTIRRWKLSAAEDDLGKYIEIMRQAAFDALGSKPWLRVGPACRDCKARHACTALHNAADNVADSAGAMSATELPATGLAVELRYLERADKILQARLTGLREQASMMLRAGIALPFFQLKQGMAREKWNKPVSEIQLLGELLNLELTKPAPITPAQARKLGLTSEIVAAYADRPHGEFKLVAVTDEDAKRIFVNG